MNCHHVLLIVALALSGCDPDPESDTDTGEGGDDTNEEVGGTYIDDFMDESTIDPSRSTGLMRDGWLVGTPAFQLSSAGDGVDGTWVAAGDESLPNPVYAFTTGTIESGSVSTPGDIRIMATEGFTVAAGASFFAAGALSIVSEGPIDLCGAVNAGGIISIEQLSSDPVRIGCGASSRVNNIPNGGIDGSVFVLSRGPVVLDGGDIVTLTSPPGALSSVTIASDSDVTLSGGAFVSAGAGVALRIYTKGGLFASEGTYAESGGAGTGTRGGELDVRLQGDFTMDSAGLYANDGGSVAVTLAGLAHFSNSAVVHATGFGALQSSLEFTAGSVDLELYSGLYTVPDATPLTVRTEGDMLMRVGAGLYAADAACGDGGQITLEVGGDLNVSDDSEMYAGHGSCTGVGGTVTAEVAGTITTPSGGIVAGDDGDGDGEIRKLRS